MDKEYIAKIKLGIITDTWDMEGQIIEQSRVKKISLEKLSEVVNSFSGSIYQMPPVFSAKKISGKPAYYYARSKKIQKEEIKLKPEIVKIYKIDIISLKEDIFDIKVKCSSGTYIRSLAFEIGRKLGCGATLAELIRNKIGNYDLKNSIEIDKLELIALGFDIKKFNNSIIPAEDIIIPFS
jgi:tRNA pseudouridine55 synthase